MTQRLRWHGFADSGSLQCEASEWILSAAGRAIAERGEFSVVLAGGETPRATYRLLCAATTAWDAWRVYFGDERCVPVDDPERNSAMARTEWLDHVPLPAHRIHPIPAEYGARRGAQRYADTLRSVGLFDLVLLGLGDDGHTASLFPGHDWGQESNSPDTLAVFGSPKPPPERVSLSAARLSRARSVVFLVAGESKREILNHWRTGAPIPARAIAPPGGADVLTESALIQTP